MLKSYLIQMYPRPNQKHRHYNARNSDVSLALAPCGIERGGMTFQTSTDTALIGFYIGQ